MSWLAWETRWISGNAAVKAAARIEDDDTWRSKLPDFLIQQACDTVWHHGKHWNAMQAISGSRVPRNWQAELVWFMLIHRLWTWILKVHFISNPASQKWHKLTRRYEITLIHLAWCRGAGASCGLLHRAFAGVSWIQRYPKMLNQNE